MIYICVPAHNEEQTVGVVLWKVRQVMAELDRDYQLLVADDGSTDRTSSVLEPYTRVLPLTVLRNESRRGYAAALEMLLREAVRRSEYPRRDAVVVLQADFSEDPEHVATLIKRLESGADIVAGNAVYGGPEPRRGYRWGRALLDRLLRRFSWPDGVRDPVNGLNAYRVMCVKSAFENHPQGRLLQHEGWAANAELLREAAPAARRIDTLDLELRRDRLQRPERFHFGTVFKQVLGYLRRRPTSTRSAEALAPDLVLGGRSQLRALTIEGLREQGYANGIETEPRRRSGGRRPSERRKDGRGKSERTRTSGRARGAAGEDQPERPRRKKRPAAAQAGEAAGNGKAGDGKTGDGAEEERTPRPRSRRRSRGGAKNRARRAPEAASQGTSAATDASAEDAAESSVAVSSPEGQTADAPRKRRRGSRGGRRRKRGQRGGGEDAANANSNDAPDPPADAG